MVAERAELLAELSTLLLYVGRKLSLHRPADPGVVQVSALESMFVEHIRRNPGITPSQIAFDLALKSSNTSAVLRTIEQKGLLRRTTDPNDRRLVQLFLTEAAEESIARVYEDWIRILDPLITDDADLVAAIRLLSALDNGWR